tara:strand:+ start:104 stop:292 length:189 start_codon:yes stop_codon:yes gene_type:complete
MTEQIKWRATLTYENQQMTVEFQAPRYDKNINYSHLARVVFVRMLRDYASPLKITNVEPVER